MGHPYKRKGQRNYTISWFDENGHRHTKSSGTTDKGAAQRILNKKLADVALVKSGVVSASQNLAAKANVIPIETHLAAYEKFSRLTEAPRWVNQKIRFLRMFFEHSGARRLSDLNADALSMFVASLRDRGLSAAATNKHRNACVAFVNWARKTRRIESNPLEIVPRFDEKKDRRRIRRPLTSDELSRLFTVAAEQGRLAWYACAYYGGLRKGDLQRLRWTDVDFEHQRFLIEDGKAKRSDPVAMHDELVAILKRHRDQSMVTPRARVFLRGVTDRERQLDFIRAGLAREEVVLGDDGQPVMTGKGRSRRPKTRFVCEDEDGRVVDLHALRKTIATDFARSGARTGVTQQFMRHASSKTTEADYISLGICDQAAAIARIPAVPIGEDRGQRTGTVDEPDPARQQIRQQSGRETPRAGATECENKGAQHRRHGESSEDAIAEEHDSLQQVAKHRDKAGGRTQPGPPQPAGLLTHIGLSLSVTNWSPSADRVARLSA